MKKLIFLAVFLFCGMALFSCADQTFDELRTEEASNAGGSEGEDDDGEPE